MKDEPSYRYMNVGMICLCISVVFALIGLWGLNWRYAVGACSFIFFVAFLFFLSIDKKFNP